MFDKQHPSNFNEDPYKSRGKAYPERITSPHDPNSVWKSTPAPKPITIADLFPRLDRLSIGWSPILEQLREVTQNKPSYPPYDIVSLKNNVNLLNVAVAGFTKEEITVSVEDSVLIIEGQKEATQLGDVLYQGIATRDFSLKLAVAEYWEVTNARLEHGMLTVQFNKILPDEKKPKVIDIE
jgi:molecular chaperone IbpA